MTVRDLLVATRALFVKRGWSRSGKLCVLHTVEAAFDKAKQPVEAWPVVAVPALALLATTAGVKNIVTWNYQQNSVEQVIALIDAALRGIENT